MTDNSDKDRSGAQGDLIDDLIDALDEWDIEADSREQDAPGTGGQPAPSDGGMDPQKPAPESRRTSSAPLYAPDPMRSRDEDEGDEESTRLINMSADPKYQQLVRSMRGEHRRALEEDAISADDEDTFESMDTPVTGDALNELRREEANSSFGGAELVADEDDLFADEDEEDRDHMSAGVDEVTDDDVVESAVHQAEPGDEPSGEYIEGGETLARVDTAVDLIADPGEDAADQVLGADDLVVDAVMAPDAPELLVDTTQVEPVQDLQDAGADLPAGLHEILDRLTPKTGRALEFPMRALPPLDELLDEVVLLHEGALVTPFQATLPDLATRCEASAENGEDVQEITGFLCEAARLKERRLAEFERARELYVLALQLNPGDPVALSGRRRMSARGGYSAGLSEQIDAELSVPRADVERLELLLLKAECLLAGAPDSVGAVGVLREAASLAPNDVRPIISLAALAQRDGDTAQLADRVVELTEKLPPGALRSAGHALVAGLFESLGEGTVALAHYKEAARHDGAGPSVWSGLARASLSADQPRAAAESMQTLAANLGPGLVADALRRRAAALLTAQGSPDAGLALLETPTDRYQWAVARDAAMELGQRASACQALAAIASSTTDPVARASTLVDLVLRGGADDRDATRRALDELLEHEPDQPMVASARAELARREEETATLALLEAGGDVSAAALFRAALMLDRRGQMDEAQRWVERARAAPAARTEAEQVLGVLCAVSHDWQGLSEILHRAEGSLDSTLLRAGALLRLGQLHEFRLGDGVSARAGYARAQELEPGFLPALLGLVRTGADLTARHQTARRLAEVCRDSGSAPERYITAALMAEEAGATGAALEGFTDALSIAPGHPLALLGAERIHRRTGGKDELIGLWRRAASDGSAGGAAYWLTSVGLTMLRANSLDDAEEVLVRAFEHCPEDASIADTLTRLPWSSRRSDWLAGALSVLSSAQRVAALIRSAEQIEPVDPESAYAWFQEARSLEPGRVDAEQGMERTLVQLGKTEGLEEQLLSLLNDTLPERAALSIHEKLIDLAGLRGDVSAETKRREDLLERSQSALTNLHWLSARYLSDRRWSDLAAVFERLARVIEDPAASAGAAAMAVRLQSLDEKRPFGSLDTAELAVSHRPDDVRALLNLYQAAQHAANDEAMLRAAAGLAQHLGLPRCRGVYELRAAEALVRLERLEEAESALHRAGEDGGHPLGWWHGSRLAEARGNVAAAAQAAEVSARMAQAPHHQTSEFLRAGRLWLERVGDASKALRALQSALEIDETCEEAFELATLAMNDESADPQIALDIIIQRLDSERPRAEVIDLGARGAALALGLGDLESAKHLLLTVLYTDAEHVDSLKQLSTICLQDGSWEEAASCLHRLAHLTEDPKEIEEYYLGLGTLAQDHLNDPKQAIQAFQRVLAASPDNLDALRRLSALLPEERLWRAAAEVNAKLSELEPDVPGKRDALLRLARAFEVGLNVPMRAQMALDEARRLDPTDLTTMEALVRYFQRQGQEQALRVHLDLAASEYRKILEGDPCDIAAYHALFQVNAWQGRGDGARSASAVLATFGAATEEEQHLLTQHGGMGWQPGPAVADTRLDEHLSPFAVTATLRALFSHIGDALLRLHPQTPRSVGVSRSDRLGRGQPAFELIQGMVTWYGMREVEVYAHPSDRNHWSLLAGGTPALVLGRGLIDGADAGELRFLIGRGLAILQRKLTIVHQLEPRKVALLLPAIVKTVAPNFELENIDEALLAELTREVNKALPKKIRSEIGPFALECIGGLQDGAPELSGHLVEFADRSGLLAAGGLRPALSALRKLQGLPASAGTGQHLDCIAADLRSGALLRFFVSPEHSEVREKLGLAFPI